VTGAFQWRELPPELRSLVELALDMRWTWSHGADTLWEAVDPQTWRRTENPWHVLQEAPRARLLELSRDPSFLLQLRDVMAGRRAYLEAHTWCAETYRDAAPQRIAYFSMEFGLGAALPLYAGGLGVLSGDYLKTASDLGLPAVGVGLLYQQGYFRQWLTRVGAQQEAYPINDPTALAIQPATGPAGDWLRFPLTFPGRAIQVRVWQAQVGRVVLYLLDTNDPLNTPADRGITGALYGGGPETRLAQEIVLGIGGWRALEALRVPVDVCHLNEGHAAFAVVERARHFMAHTGLTFWEALWATRAGNLFTTHTAVAAGFDVFTPELIEKYFHPYLPELGLSVADLLALGRAPDGDDRGPFNMAFLALRACAGANGVSRLHGAVSRSLFGPLYPRWHEREVPIGYVTNGVHMPSWDSPEADRLWTQACGKERWLGHTEELASGIQALTDEELWGLRNTGARSLVEYTRRCLTAQLGQRGYDAEVISKAHHALDPGTLTLGFARRFAEYKRPALLLTDPQRFQALLTDPARPVQIVIAGKAHPADEAGKRQVEAWLSFIRQPATRARAVFLEDYDMAVAQQMVQGVDVWVNTPRRPWEACGTSGMKVLVNGGLNLSVLDGWWDEAYTPEVGWALGDAHDDGQPDQDAADAEELYRLLEQEVVPPFYARDARGIPPGWIARMRASMGTLTPAFNSNRMLREYLERYYLPAARRFRARSADNGALARALRAWEMRVSQHWNDLRFGPLQVQPVESAWAFSVECYLGKLSPDDIGVELYAEAVGTSGEAFRQEMERGDPIPNSSHGYVYRATVPSTRPSSAFTARALPFHRDVVPPSEIALIRWER